jgi:hypothetical protein
MSGETTSKAVGGPSAGWAGWVEAHELPVSAHLRSLGEILSAPPTAEERRAQRREQAEQEQRRAAVLDAADASATQGFIARMNGHAPRDPLAEAAAEPFGGRDASRRRRAAIDVLRPLGLADVITGGQSGVILDANMGVLEPVPDVAQRAGLDRQYEAERSERLAEEGRAIVNRSRVQLQARRRAAGLDGPRVSHRSAVPDAEAVYRRACAEIGCPVDGDGPARASLGTDYFGRPVTAAPVSYR